jgi:hypothetical protein
MNINFEYWEELIKKPTWYLELVPEFKKWQSLHDKDEDLYEKTKEEVYDFFEKHLIKYDIALAENGEDFDKDRKEIDTAIIHHTSNPSGMTKNRLSAIELVRLYAPYYFKPYTKGEDSLRGQPIWSNHLRNGKLVFWPYHWLIREDGSSERLLLDNEIGWHAGNWDVNTRSVGICLDGDYENGRPSDLMLNSLAKLIKENYPKILKEKVLGHSEVNEKTVCPSKIFLSTEGKKGWKEDLLKLL